MSSQKTEPQVICVWSPPGSPGRTTIAAAIAAEKAKLGNRVLVIDADSYAPSIEFQFGIEQAHLGVASLARIAMQEKLTEEQLDKLTVDFQFGKINLKVVTGISMPDRWQEVGFDGIRAIVEFARDFFDCIVIDTAPPIEQDIINQNSLVNRNAMTLAALQNASHIVAVCGASAVAIHRFVWEYQGLRQLNLRGKLLTLVNQVHGGSRQISQTLQRLAGVEIHGFIDHDQAAASRAQSEGVPITFAGRNSAARAQLAKFVLTKLD